MVFKGRDLKQDRETWLKRSFWPSCKRGMNNHSVDAAAAATNRSSCSSKPLASISKRGKNMQQLQRVKNRKSNLEICTWFRAQRGNRARARLTAQSAISSCLTSFLIQHFTPLFSTEDFEFIFVYTDWEGPITPVSPRDDGQLSREVAAVRRTYSQTGQAIIINFQANYGKPAIIATPTTMMMIGLR